MSSYGETGNKKAALTKREDFLVALGRWVEAGGFYDRIVGVLHGLFQDAYDPTGIPIPPDTAEADLIYYTAKDGLTHCQARQQEFFCPWS